jgi:SAM-dependent methyltransferase
MGGREKMNEVLVSGQNISYYNAIAGSYDAILSNDAANQVVRTKVAAYFTKLVKGGHVLDFGGGTGQDLGWLLHHHYHILFCEPSYAMRQIALERSMKEFPAADILFMDDQNTDFRNWDDNYPFEKKMDAVLANFAVINCIPDISLLFEKMAKTLNPGGTVLMLMLDNSLKKRLRTNMKGTVRSWFTGNPVDFFVDYNGNRQLVYIHSVKEIKKALADKFEFKNFERLEGFGYCLIHLTRI